VVAGNGHARFGRILSQAFFHARIACPNTITLVGPHVDCGPSGGMAAPATFCIPP